jgi:hypothetical protein
VKIYCVSDMAGATVKVETTEWSETTRGKGPWMRDVERKVSEAIEIGLRSSVKAETREYRVKFYTEKLTRAKIEVEYYEKLLRLEEEQASIPRRYNRLEEELRELELKDRVTEMRGRVGVGGDSREAYSEGASTPRTEAEWDTTTKVDRREDW